MPISIAFLAFPGFHLLDLTGPLAAFDSAARFCSPAPYRIEVRSLLGGVVLSSAGVGLQTTPLDDEPVDTVVAVGGMGAIDACELAELAPYVEHITAARSSSRRIASVCSGAFLLAAAGVLDGRKATTHWRNAARLQRKHPAVKVDADRIFTRDGSIWTSAGVTAGIDLALALIEDDLGGEVARSVARDLVVYYRRPGGQSQFSALLELDPGTDRIRSALTFARENLHTNLSVERLAEAARLSPRQFARAFAAQTGQTPAKAIEQLRAEVARQRIESTRDSIEAIGRSVGFVDPERMRRAFLRKFGCPPQSIRRMSRAHAEMDAGIESEDSERVPQDEMK